MPRAHVSDTMLLVPANSVEQIVHDKSYGLQTGRARCRSYNGRSSSYYISNTLRTLYSGMSINKSTIKSRMDRDFTQRMETNDTIYIIIFVGYIIWEYMFEEHCMVKL